MPPNPPSTPPSARRSDRAGPLRRLRGILRDRGVPVGPVVVADGRLRLWLHTRPGRSVELHLGPPGEQPPFRRVGAFALGYSGAPELEDLEQTWVALLVALLTRSAARLPALLGRPAAVGTDGLPFGEALPLEFPFCTVEIADDADGSGPRMEVLVRMTTRCNQRCPFCSAPPPFAKPPLAELRRLFDRVFAKGMRGLITLTGGEPTLRGDLPEIVTHALSGPPHQHVHIQTNAVSFADPQRAAAYPTDPRLSFFVSFHAADEALYDRCTGTTGQFESAIDGIRNLLAGGWPVLINCVVNRINAAHLTDWVEAIPRLFPDGDRLLHFSVTMCPEHRETAPDTLIRYGELAPQLEAAVTRAETLGLPHDPLLDSTHAAIPACLVSEVHRSDPSRRARIGAHETGYEDLRKQWVKAARCRDCRVDAWCLGLPRPYAERFGLDELEPLT